MNLGAPARVASEFEVPPRSAAPVSVPLMLQQAPQRRRRNLATTATVGVLLLAGVGAAAYFKSGARATKLAAAPIVSTAAALPAPSAAPIAPIPSSEAEAATPEPSAEPEKPAAKGRASAAPTRAAAAAKRDDAPRAASAKKADLIKAVSGESASGLEPAAEGESEAPAHTEEPAKKADTAGAGTAPFDRDAASTALSDAAMRSPTCRMLGGPTGSAQATVTFAPNGHVIAVNVGGDFSGSVVGACIVKLFRAAIVPPFAGEPVTVAKRFSVE